MVRSNRYGNKQADTTEAQHQELQLWILRILVLLGAHRNFLGEGGFQSDEIAVQIGLEHWIEGDVDLWPNTPTRQRLSNHRDVDGEKYLEGGYERKRVLSELRKLHRDTERKSGKYSPEGILVTNIELIASLVGLNAMEANVLRFVVMLHSSFALSEACDFLGNQPTSRLINSLSTILAIESDAVREALSPHGTLCRSGLLKVDRDGPNSLSVKLALLSRHFADYIVNTETEPLDLLRDTVAPSPPATLALEDYEHIQDSLRVARPYLHQSLQTHRSGVNVFIYGPPGTGKTELARTLAADLGCDLYQVSTEDEEGDSISATARLRAYRVAQSMLATRKAMLVFDEAEDVYGGKPSFWQPKSTAQTHKGWINRLLEDNPVPTIWLSNSIGSLDPAFVRRYDMVIEVPVPPRSRRQQIIKSVCGDVADESVIARLAECCSLAPAVAARAASVVRSISPGLGKALSTQAFERLVGSTLEAQGHSPILRNDPNRLPAWYRQEALHVDADLANIALGLKRTKQGRFCFYGPPGTGKTACGRWLAQQLDMPLVVKRGSDLLSKWLGDSEKLIAQAFREAEREGALLLIDEVDSFLQDRRGASHSWEVTQVNELLTQMEGFSGIFIASTNLLQGLDQAALRRFDIKVKFDYLLAEQGWTMFTAQCAALDMDPPTPSLQASVSALRNLTPGDFAAVARQHRFNPLGNAAGVLGALQRECLLKEDSQNVMGFV